MENLRKIILLLIFVTPFIGVAQIPFFKKFTSGPFDQGNGITQLPDSSYAVTGASGGFDENSGQAYLMLIDSVGNHLWTKNYGGTGDDVGVRVIHVPGDGFFIAGYTSSTPNADFDFVLYKTDETGELQWEKRYGGSDWEKLHDAKLLADGGLILVGQTEGLSTDGVDMFLVRTDALGDTLWTKTIQSPEDDVAYAVDTISSTRIVVGGDMGDGGVLKGMLASFNVDGTQEWIKFFDQSGITRVRNIVVFEGHVFLFGGLYNSDQSRIDRWLGKGDFNGDYVGHWTHPYQEDAMVTAGTIRDAFSVYLGFQTKSPELNPFQNGNDVFTMKFGANLVYIGASQNFSAVDEDIIHQMITANDGGIVLVGTVSDDGVNPSLGTDIMVARIGPGDEVVVSPDTGLDFVSLQEEKKSILTVFPNPTEDLIYFSDNVIGMHYEILNFQGQVVLEGVIESTVSLHDLNSGIYVIKVQDQDQLWTGKIIKR
nr:T9SS type A sorting domain-containing protein [uncultured Brumimicrobium sp.]